MFKKMTKKEYFAKEKELIGTSTVDFDGPVITGGKGAIGYDLDGKEFLDFAGQISLLNTGYAPEEVVNALKKMAAKLHSCISADWPYRVEISIGRKKTEVSRVALAERLIKITDKAMPFKKRVIFEVSGATAVNLATKIAKISYLRSRGMKTENFQSLFEKDILIPSEEDCCRFSFLAFEKAFHGRHGEAHFLSTSKTKHLWAVSSSCAVGRLPFPAPGIGYIGILKKAEDLIAKLDKIAPVIALVFEPVQGEGGINVPDGKALKALLNYLKIRHNICLIADEVQTGFGRTGKMFACEHFGIEPDMIIMSKSLGAGLPIGAVVVNAEKFPDLEPGMHSGSMHANPLAVAAAIANIDLILKKNLVDRSLYCGEYALRRLKEIAKFHQGITDVRGLGLMIGIEFETVEYRDRVAKKCKEKGLLIANCGEKVIRMTPPLIVTIDEIDKALDIFEKALEDSKN